MGLRVSLRGSFGSLFRGSFLSFFKIHLDDASGNLFGVSLVVFWEFLLGFL